VEAAFGRARAAGFEGVRHDAPAAVEDRRGRREGRYVTATQGQVGLPAGRPDGRGSEMCDFPLNHQS
jgi:hypothetical protein